MITKTKVLSLARSGMGGLSNASKMPCYSWSISAFACKTGGKLSKIKGSVCSKCYAKKSNYLWPNTKAALERRLSTYNEDNLRFKLTACIVLSALAKHGEEEFRWFDSGDLTSSTMLSDFCFIARKVPELKFWLPTKEEGYVREFLRTGEDIPSNLCIRLSAPMIGSRKSSVLHLKHPQITMSYVDVEGDDIFHCPAKTQGNKCDTCRACWDPKLYVSYKET